MVINKKVIIGAIIVAVLLAVYGMLTLNGVAFKRDTTGQATAFMTVIAPGVIPTQDLSLLAATATPTPNSSIGDLKGIRIDLYVQISGTDGVGLKIRDSAGLNSQMVFLGGESEVFQVIDGPVEADGVIWWKLTTPYDSSRQGWASADYLTVIEGQ